MNKARILIADDHAVVRTGLKFLLSAEAGFSVVGEAQDGVQAVDEALRLKPDMILLDLMMPKKDGVSVTEELRRRLPEAKILILTSFGTSEDLSRAILAGASGVVLKSSAETEIIPAIREILAGQQHLAPGLRNLIRRKQPAIELTGRQETILRSVMEGLSNADIARQQGLAEITVKNHLTAVFNKLKVNNRSEAVVVALRKHLLKI